MKAKDLLVKYSLEFFVIVLGISVSFWLNELAVERTHEQERVKVLQSLHAWVACGAIRHVKDLLWHCLPNSATCVAISNAFNTWPGGLGAAATSEAVMLPKYVASISWTNTRADI